TYHFRGSSHKAAVGTRPRPPGPRKLPPSPPSRQERPMTPSESRKLLDDVDAFCQDVRPVEELCYAEHRYNDQVVPLAKKHNILGMIVPPALGGRGADTTTYAL